MLEKIGLFCNVRKKDVIQNLTAPSLYEVPMMLEEEGLAECVCEHLKLNNPKPDLADWIEMINRQKAASKTVNIGLVGKYVALPDAYLSVAEALRHGGIVNDADVNIEWINSEEISSETVGKMLDGCDGIIVPGGFGDRGIEGMIDAIKYARENKIPFFGICLGMQMAVVEYARNVAGLDGANSTEFAPDGKTALSTSWRIRRTLLKRAEQCVWDFIPASLYQVQDAPISTETLLYTSVIVTVGNSITPTAPNLRTAVLK